MIASDKKIDVRKVFIGLMMAMTFTCLITACTTKSTVQQQNLDSWTNVPVEVLDSHVFFKTVPMFRTKTDSGTEIRNYAYGFDFQECASKAGATNIGDFMGEDAFIACSSSKIVCNNMFYIKEGIVLEYAPTGRCDTGKKIQPHAENRALKN